MNEKKRLVPVRWWVAFWLFISYVVWYLDRSNISVTATHMMKEYNWNAAQFGAIMSAFFLGYSLTQIPGGWLADRVGGSKVINLGTAWWSLFTMLTPAGTTVYMMSIIRFLMGMGEGVNAPAHVSITSQWMPKREYGRAAGLYLIGVPLGIMITMPTAAWITNQWGWRWVFYIFGLVGFAWCAVWLYYGRSRPEEHPKISKEEIALIRGDQDSGVTTKEPTNWKALLSNSAVWGTVLSYFACNYCMYLYLSWLPGYLIMAKGFSFNKTAFTAMIPWCFALVTIALSGIVSDKLTTKFGPNVGRKYLIYAAFIGVGLFTVLAAKATTDFFVILFLSMAVGSLMIAYPSYYTIPMDISARDGGVIYGMVNTSGTIAGVVAPALTGLIVVLSGNNWEYALYFAAAVAALGAVMISFVNVRSITKNEAVQLGVSSNPEVAD